MTSALSETYIPDDEDQVAEVLSFLHAHEAKNGAAVQPHYFLSGASEHDHIEISPKVHSILTKVLEAMAQGKAVNVAPQEPQLTTQRVADLLGVSRPTVIRLIDSGELAATRLGKHRRILLTDALALREKQRNAILDFLAESSDDTVGSQESLRKARRVVARRRGAKR
jgi:excisionase family DNA binding protein